MPANRTRTTEEIVLAYQETGSVWAAGKRVGLAGQTVWERLRSVGYPMRARFWTAAENAELASLAAAGCPIGEIARRLGRPYGAVATRMSTQGLTNRSRQRVPKVPRGAGFDKEAVGRRTRELDRYDGSLRQYCRANGLNIEPLVVAIQRHFPVWWDAYAAARTDLASARCAYCEREFFPMSGKQKCCSRRCSSDLRNDTAYFGGKRRAAIGLAEGVCQLCLQEKKTLSAHHVFGKENDPENEHLVALCPGCHNLVGILAGRRFVEDGEGWERLASLVLMRRYGGNETYGGVHIYVDIENLTHEEWDASEEAAA